MRFHLSPSGLTYVGRTPLLDLPRPQNHWCHHASRVSLSIHAATMTTPTPFAYSFRHAQAIITLVFQEHTATQSIHAQTIIPFVFKEHTMTQSIHARTIVPFVFQEHTMTQSIHAQAIISFVFQEHTVTQSIHAHT